MTHKQQFEHAISLWCLRLCDPVWTHLIVISCSVYSSSKPFIFGPSAKRAPIEAIGGAYDNLLLVLVIVGFRMAPSLACDIGLRVHTVTVNS